LKSVLVPILLSPLMARLGGEASKKLADFDDYCRKQMNERINAAATTKREDFVHYLLDASDLETGKGFTRDDLDHEAALLIGAGADTTSTALAATIYYLTHNTEALEKATTEVRKRYTSLDDIHGDTVHDLRYLQACFDEALRMSPPVPSHVPREVCSGGITIDGQYYPAGTVVCVSPYAIHHNSEYYPSPMQFRPERWIVDDAGKVSEESVATAKAAFCPFSLGTRGCVGKQVAYLEAMIALASLLFTYDMRLAGANTKSEKGTSESVSEAAEFRLVDGFLSERHGPMVEYRRSG
jgi:cytochrome P450